MRRVVLREIRGMSCDALRRVEITLAKRCPRSAGRRGAMRARIIGTCSTYRIASPNFNHPETLAELLKRPSHARTP